MSTHKVEVVEVKLETHPNADTLSVVRIGGFTVCTRTADWKPGDLGAYVQPDSVVDTSRPEFSFLATEGRAKERIKVMRLRGVISMGLLVPAPAGSKVGDNVMELLGVEHYEPPLNCTHGEDTKAPKNIWNYSYDVENARNYIDVLQEGEQVLITEKIHGANARFVFANGEFHVGTRTTWKKRAETTLWWAAANQNLWLETWCRLNPGIVVYGEVYGKVQELRYGLPDNKYGVVVFDLLRGSDWIPYPEVRDSFPGIWAFFAPIVYEGPYNAEQAYEFAEGDSLIPGADHVREGVVVKPANERSDLRIGRVQLKIVGNGYFEGKKASKKAKRDKSNQTEITPTQS